MKIVSGGITGPKGFWASAVNAGIKKSRKPDLALIFSSVPAASAGVFTQNKFAAWPVLVSRRNLKKGLAQAVIINSGNANCANGKTGFSHAKKMTEWAAQNLKIAPELVLVASTGIIGKPLPIASIKEAIPCLVKGLNKNAGQKAAQAILTTDTKIKEVCLNLKIGGRPVNICGMAKGVGMIYPNLATMLALITTDALITSPLLKSALKAAVDTSFNSITVDGETSTNDSVIILANGLAANKLIRQKDKNFKAFKNALGFVCLELAKKIIEDAEGATKFIQVKVTAAKSQTQAKRVAFKIANSNLVKTSIFGENPNWGRVFAAVGASGETVGTGIDISFGKEKILRNGELLNYNKNRLNKILKNYCIAINVNLHKGHNTATVYTSDLTCDYVRINAGYN